MFRRILWYLLGLGEFTLIIFIFLLTVMKGSPEEMLPLVAGFAINFLICGLLVIILVVIGEW